MGHLEHHWYEYLATIVFSSGFQSWLSYAAQEFPVPDGKYWRWVLKIIQKWLGNQNKVDEIKAADGKQSNQ